MDLAAAVELANNLFLLFKKYRDNSESKFHELYTIAENLAEEISEEITIPRKTKYQSYRDNYDTRSTEEYCRLSIFIPFIDHFICSLEERFVRHKDILSRIQNILPDIIVTLNEMEIGDSIDVILSQWPDLANTSDSVLRSEALLWQQKWLGLDDRPKSFIDTINICNKSVFPNIYNMLKVCCTIPVTVATAERSFSTLKRLKTYLRNSTGERRLNGLALMSIHRDIGIDVQEVINKFAAKHRRIPL